MSIPQPAPLGNPFFCTESQVKEMRSRILPSGGSDENFDFRVWLDIYASCIRDNACLVCERMTSEHEPVLIFRDCDLIHVRCGLKVEEMRKFVDGL